MVVRLCVGGRVIGQDAARLIRGRIWGPLVAAAEQLGAWVTIERHEVWLHDPRRERRVRYAIAPSPHDPALDGQEFIACLSLEGVLAPLAPLARFLGAQWAWDPEANAVRIVGLEPDLAGRWLALDAGHGGRDLGAVGGAGLIEKALNLDVACRVREYLSAAGSLVRMSRLADQTLDAQARIERLAGAGGRTDGLLSIHHNSSAQPDACGIEVYHNGYGNAERWARLLLHELLAELDAGRGLVGPAPMDVIRAFAAPAVHVECGYVSHPRERARLADAWARERTAMAIFRATRAFFGSDKLQTGS